MSSPYPVDPASRRLAARNGIREIITIPEKLNRLAVTYASLRT
jgi:hypothetical protein